MNSIPRQFLVVLLFVFAQNEMKAAHILGADMSYECISNCTTRLYQRVYTDCSPPLGISIQNPTITAIQGCLNLPFFLGPPQLDNSVEVTPICPSLSTDCVDPNSQYTGVVQHLFYSDINVCVAGSCNFLLTFSKCCRPSGINSINDSGNQSLFVTSTLNNSQIGCNNAPNLPNYSTVWFCDSDPVTVNFSGKDIDGDSLSYALTACKGATGLPLTYLPSFSYDQPFGPLWDVQFDPFLGQMSLTPIPGEELKTVLCLTISEWRYGQLLNQYTNDILLEVHRCPQYSLPVFGGYTVNSPGTVAYGDSFVTPLGEVMDVDFSTLDASGSGMTKFYWSSLQNAEFTDANNPAIHDTIVDIHPEGNLKYMPYFPGTYQVVFTLENNSCPVRGIQSKAITISVTEPVQIFPPSKSGEMASNEENLFQWSVSPNPSSGRQVLQLQLPEDASPQIRLFDMKGMEISQQSYSGLHAGRHSVEMDHSNVPAGFYIIEMHLNGQRHMKKIIVQH